MAASNSDMFTEVGSPGSATSLASPGHTIAGTSITVGSTSNWPTNTGVIFAIDTVTLVNGVETRDTGSYTEWEGVVTSGTTVDNLVLRYGTDQNYPAGSTTRVYIPVASSRENRFAQGAVVSLNQDGTLKSGVVSSTVIADGAVTTAKVADASITPAKLGLAKTTDANGWVVRDYGTWKTYERQYTCSSVVVAANSNTAIASSIPLPVGITDDSSLRLYCGILGGFAGRIYASLDNGNVTSHVTTMNLSLGNLTTGSITFSGYVYVFAIAV